MLKDEALFTVVADDETYSFTTAEDFYDFMSEKNAELIIDRIEKNEN
jgi:hypothetical protein